MPKTIFDCISEGSLKVVGEEKGKIICECPLCGGTNLKINSNQKSESYGAWACWDKCETPSVKAHLGLPEKGGKALFQESHLQLTKEVAYRGRELILCPFFSNPPLGNTVYYPYTENLRLKRVDGKNRKYFTFEYFDKESQQWIKGSQDITPPLYTYGIPQKSGDTVIWVEGEKCADFVKTQGLAAITSSSITYRRGPLTCAVILFRAKFPKIKNCIIIPDCDTPGKHKAELALEATANVGIGAKIIWPNEVLLTNYKKGEDICDFPELLDYIKDV